MSSITSNTHAERTEALQKGKRKAAKDYEIETRQLRKKIAAAEEERDDTVRRLEADAENTRRTLADGIAAEWHEQASEPVREFLREPTRAGAVALGNLWRELDARARSQIGEPLWEGMIVIAFAETVRGQYPAIVNRDMLSHDLTGKSPATRAAAFAKAAQDDNPAQMVAALEGLEGELRERGAREGGPADPGAERTFEEMGKSATLRDATRRRGELEDSRKAEQLRRFKESYVPPPATIRGS